MFSFLKNYYGKNMCMTIHLFSQSQKNSNYGVLLDALYFIMRAI